jgi:hypothetical protein
VTILMTWSAEQTLQARFAATRHVVRSLFPKWKLGLEPSNKTEPVLSGTTEPFGPADAVWNGGRTRISQVGTRRFRVERRERRDVA